MIKDGSWKRFIDPAGAKEACLVGELEKPCYRRRGFLPEPDPLRRFSPDSELGRLDEIGRDLPSLLHDKHFRTYAMGLTIPPWTARPDEHNLPALRLYYLRVGFLASGYINQVGQPPAHQLPANIAVPLVHACNLLGRPPILSYDGYALYNWKRFDPKGPVALGNIDTLQNFVHLYDEHWFILVHVEIEAIAAEILGAVAAIKQILASQEGDIGAQLRQIESAVRRQTAVLERIPEHMDPNLYYKTFRPYIRFFDHVVYEGVEQDPIQFRGETGAQSSIMPTLVALMKIPHKPSMLTDHLADMRNYMPTPHRALIAEVAAMPDIRRAEYKAPFNAVLDAMAEFRRIHYGWADEYIHRRTADPRGTGGTPYMQWLRQMIDETIDHKL